ncbi:MAG: serine hydrolase domain-containing protein [Candidatus Hodarchaeota archaeon]
MLHSRKALIVLLSILIIFTSINVNLMFNYLEVSSFDNSFEKEGVDFSHLHIQTHVSSISSTDKVSAENIDTQITSLMEQGFIPSLAAAITQNDNISWVKGYGEQPNVTNTYQVGSITKSFIATALLQLYEQGVFELDDDVNDYLPFIVRNPSFPDTSITFRMLLTHTSSLNTSQDNYWKINLQDWFKKLNNSNLTYPSDAWGGLHLEHFSLENYTYNFHSFVENSFLENGTLYTSDIWGSWAPNIRYEYANLGFELLGYLLEILSNKTIEQYLSEKIFSPLNMTDTGFNSSKFDPNTLLIPHTRVNDQIFEGPPYDSLAYGAGALRTTANDLAKFLAAHMNDGLYKGVRILEKETIELMHSRHISFTTDPYVQYYGLGWQQLPSCSALQGHTGHTPGFTSQMVYTQRKDYSNISYGIIMLINQDEPDWTAYGSIISTLFDKASNFVPEDYNPTKVNIIQPNGGEILEGTELISWNVTDPGAFRDLQFTGFFSADNITWYDIPEVSQPQQYLSQCPWTVQWDTSGISEGWYWLKIVASRDQITAFDVSDQSFYIKTGISTNTSLSTVTSNVTSVNVSFSSIYLIVVLIGIVIVKRKFFNKTSKHR